MKADKTQLLEQFYINEEQSIYLMSHEDARKVRDWLNLCQEQLAQLGFTAIELVGKGAFGFVFGGRSPQGENLVFKFSRINLPQVVQDRLEEEAWMQSLLVHRSVPKFYEYTKLARQSVLVMERAKGIDLEAYSLQVGRLSARLIVRIAWQLVEVLNAMRNYKNERGEEAPLVHGDIKPSNIVFDPTTETIQLVDWGSSVFAQLDALGQPVDASMLGFAASTQTNARLGDVFFIGDEQLNGGLSSPRFDEQGLAGTLYALASAQSCRHGIQAIPATSLDLPPVIAANLQEMLTGDEATCAAAGDKMLLQAHHLKRWVMEDAPLPRVVAKLPVWVTDQKEALETVVYSSRRTFLRAEQPDPNFLAGINDVELEKYYKNFLQGMGPTEKAFLAAVSRLGRYPLLGGLTLQWQDQQLLIDSSLKLHDPALRKSFIDSVNNLITLARSINRQEGVFKACMFDARATRHLERANVNQPFLPPDDWCLPYEILSTPATGDHSYSHSYFEDGKDPDELLRLPEAIIDAIARMNHLRHTGLIIFEALPTHLKVHSYYVLLDPNQEGEFLACLEAIKAAIPQIDNLGVAGYMKLPYKNTRTFGRF